MTRREALIAALGGPQATVVVVPNRHENPGMHPNDAEPVMTTAEEAADNIEAWLDSEVTE